MFLRCLAEGITNLGTRDFSVLRTNSAFSAPRVVWVHPYTKTLLQRPVHFAGARDFSVQPTMSAFSAPRVVWVRSYTRTLLQRPVHFAGAFRVLQAGNNISRPILGAPDFFSVNEASSVAGLHTCTRTNVHKLLCDTPAVQLRRWKASSNPAKENKSSKWKKAAYFGGALLVTLTCTWIYRKRNLENRGFQMFYIPHMPMQMFVQFGKYKGIVTTTHLLNSVEKAENFAVRTDDIFVVSFPRSGTTWTQEIVYLITNDADREKACSKNLEERFPYLEDGDSSFMKRLEFSESPRLIKSHLPYRLLPADVRTKSPKIIYVMRNPRDMVVSTYRFWQKVKGGGYKGTFDEFCELFLRDQFMFSPWLDHVQEYWQRRNDDNILFIQYEDLIKNLPHEIQKIARFLDKPLTEDQVNAIVDHCSFDSMKKNKNVNYNWWDQRGFTSNMGDSFIRKGRVGDWKNYFSPELDCRMSEKVDKRLHAMGLDVKYEIK